MATTRSVTDEERARIVELLESGMSQGKAAREVGRSKQTVSRIARAEGIESDVTATKKAQAARLDYDTAGRLELGNELFTKVREMVRGAKTAGELKDLATTYGILTDKRRLEDGEPTERGEHTHNGSPGFDFASEIRSLDRELAELSNFEESEAADTEAEAFPPEGAV